MLEQINNAKVKEIIGALETKYYQTVEFWYDRELGYSWRASSKSHARNIYPMQSANYIKFFKTLDGAKRNFIKRITEVQP